VNRKTARFDVVSIEITVHCPRCDSLVETPDVPQDRRIWRESDIRNWIGKTIMCTHCYVLFRLHPSLKNLLAPSSEPVRTDLHISSPQTEIICANCAGDETQPKTTLMTTNQRCAGCGGTNFVLANQNGGQRPLLNEGKEIQDASHPTQN
jgi:Zn finger protein HypA/HybF involved in hydrogenase expression